VLYGNGDAPASRLLSRTGRAECAVSIRAASRDGKCGLTNACVAQALRQRLPLDKRPAAAPARRCPPIDPTTIASTPAPGVALFVGATVFIAAAVAAPRAAGRSPSFAPWRAACHG